MFKNKQKQGQWHIKQTFELPVVVLPARGVVVTVVQMRSHTGGKESRVDLLCGVVDLGTLGLGEFSGDNGDNHNLIKAWA